MKIRADLSGPVLAILVTVAIIAAGIGVLAYFWWMAPHAAKAPTLEVIGAPALDATGGKVYITVRNVGNDPIKVKGLVVNGVELEPQGGEVIIRGGDKEAIIFTGALAGITGPSVEATLVTDGGVVPVTLYVVNTAQPSQGASSGSSSGSTTGSSS